jgi:hypothetical protein
MRASRVVLVLLVGSGAACVTRDPGRGLEPGELRSALTRQDGAAALDALTQHERRFPSGILVQEREAMTVRALILLGRTEDARVRADRFRDRFPDSVLLPSVEALIVPR